MSIKKIISEKVDRWLDQEQEVENTESEINLEKQIIEQILLDRKLDESDLGGLKALRGFMYQYYVAIFYMVEMCYENKWDKVVFELLDDIAAINIEEEKIRYIQVKTKREDNQVRTLEINKDLVKRKKGLDSWIDKLFNNPKKMQEVGEVFIKQEFELATNEKGEEAVKKYYDNAKYDLINVDDRDKILLRMKKEALDGEGKGIGWTEKELKQNLKNFRIRNFKDSSEFKQAIISNIAAKQGNNIDSIPEYTALATYAFNELLLEVMSRTFDDSKADNRGDLVFDKEQVKKIIEDGLEKGRREIFSFIKKDNIRMYFQEIFSQLEKEIQGKWAGEVKEKLLQTLNHIREQLIAHDEIDEYTYQKFLSRVFELRENKYFMMLEDIQGKSKVMNVIYYLAFLEELILSEDNEKRSKLVLDNSDFLFDEGETVPKDEFNISICNMQNKLNMQEAMYYISEKSSKCPQANIINHNYYCIVEDIKKANNKFFNDDIPKTIVDDSENKRQSIMDMVNNIKFINAKEQLLELIDMAMEASTSNHRIDEINKLALNYLEQGVKRL